MLRALIKATVIAIISNLSIACGTALILTIDVSNSVDPGEYRLQIDGLAAALSDPEIA
jgi:Ca-activated chloride channel family protein